MGSATRPILDVLGLPYYTLDTVDRLDQQVSGALQLCYASRQPLALCLTPMLHGGKIA
jgi:sulfopyruvate decarboxylase TPP-binding subunit